MQRLMLRLQRRPRCRVVSADRDAELPLDHCNDARVAAGRRCRRRGAFPARKIDVVARRVRNPKVFCDRMVLFGGALYG